MSDSTDVRGAGFGRRIGAMVYDVLLIVALMMVFTAILLPLSKGEGITPQAFGAAAYLYRLGLLVVWIGFYGIFWTRQGQTLGMLAWRIKVERNGGGLLDWAASIRRLLAATVPAAIIAALGTALPAESRQILICAAVVWLAGFAALCFDSQRRTLHDRWSHTHVVVMPKKSASKK
jgi:uncharacterized RDD family membrane protein YckC